MEDEFECDMCGREIAKVAIHSGDGIEELCSYCYHEIYDSED